MVRAGQAEGPGGLILTGWGLGARSLAFPGSPSDAKVHGAEVCTGRGRVQPDPAEVLRVIQAEGSGNLCLSDALV